MRNNFTLPEIIVSDKVKAIKVNPEMCNALFEAIDSSREHLREFLFWVDDIKTPADEAKAIEHFIKTWEDKEDFMYVLFDKDNHVVGTVDVFEISYSNHIACFGYWLKPTEVGKGYISSILPPMEKILFQSGMHRLVIECEVVNKPSEAVAVRNGYNFEGIAKGKIFGYGTYRDAKVYAKVKTTEAPSVIS